MDVCPVLYGECGGGKSAIAELTWKSFLGFSHYKETDKIDELCGKFADLAQYLIVVLNEASGKDTKGVADALKNAITQSVLGVEKKGLQKVGNINRCYDIIFTTNNMSCVKLEGDADRRYFIVVCSDTHSGRDAATLQYHEELRADMANPRIMRAYFEYLKHRDISGWKARAFPTSSLRESMIEAQESPEKTWLREHFPTMCQTALYTPLTELFKRYQVFISEGNFSYAMSRNAFSAYLKSVRGLKSAKQNYGVGFAVAGPEAMAKHIRYVPPATSKFKLKD
jgi:hypothetical protein